jgi:hypothetical protein
MVDGIMDVNVSMDGDGRMDVFIDGNTSKCRSAVLGGTGLVGRNFRSVYGTGVNPAP